LANIDELLAKRKADIRKSAHAARKAAASKARPGVEIGVEITDRLRALPEYQSAATVMWYINVRDEVSTRNAVQDALTSDKLHHDKNVVIPYCVDDQLELFLLESLQELEPGKYGILEPKASLRQIAEKRPQVADIDLIVVPGVAFGVHGERLGHGKGYYDKLLQRASPKTLLVGLAMECQIFDKLPMQEHDFYMDRVVTEDRVYQGRGRR
jgi:5-formyltetrahydrofolate cyclo-ligase